MTTNKKNKARIITGFGLPVTARANSQPSASAPARNNTPQEASNTLPRQRAFSTDTGEIQANKDQQSQEQSLNHKIGQAFVEQAVHNEHNRKKIFGFLAGALKFIGKAVKGGSDNDVRRVADPKSSTKDDVIVGIIAVVSFASAFYNVIYAWKQPVILVLKITGLQWFGKQGLFPIIGLINTLLTPSKNVFQDVFFLHITKQVVTIKLGTGIWVLINTIFLMGAYTVIIYIGIWLFYTISSMLNNPNFFGEGDLADVLTGRGLSKNPVTTLL